MTSSRKGAKYVAEFPNLSEAKHVVYDTETTGVRWPVDTVAGHVVTWGPGPHETAYFPVRHEGGGNLPADLVERWLKELFARPDLRVVGHSLKFDLHMGANHGIAVRGPVECTQVNEALIDENARHFNLDDTARRYKDIPLKLGEDLYKALAQRFGGEPTRKEQIGRLYKLSGQDPLVVDYAKGDGTSTWHLHAQQQGVLDAQNLRTVWGVECRVIRTLYRMERRGVRVHIERLAWLQQHLAGELEKARKSLPKDFNVRSTPQIEKLLRDAGIKTFKMTDKGNPSFPEDWLLEHELGQHIVAVRKLENLHNTFIMPLIKEHMYGNVVHANFNQLRQDDYGVVTGRLSCNDPNMQQVPKRNKELGPLFRMIFIPAEGHDWCANDYNQQEYRLFAEYLNNAALIAGYNAVPPVDMHTTVANMLGVERDPTAKRMNFGMINGMGVKKLRFSLKTTMEQAQAWLNTYHSNIPEAKKFLRDAEYWARQRGWVRTKLYRRRRFPDPRIAHKAGNSIIQGTAADMTKLKMVEIDEHFEKVGAESFLMLQIHDDLSWSQAPGEEEVSREAQRIMVSFTENDLIHLKVPHAIDSVTAGDWGRASFPKYDWTKVPV